MHSLRFITGQCNLCIKTIEVCIKMTNTHWALPQESQRCKCLGLRLAKGEILCTNLEESEVVISGCIDDSL